MKLILLVGVFCFLMSSCTTYYGSANFSEESSVYLKPAYRDTLAKASYLSASVNRGDPDGGDTFENFIYGNLSYNKSFTEKHVSYAYGGYAHVGRIKFSENNLELINNSISEHNELTINNIALIDAGNYFFAGGGVSAEVNLNIPFKKLDWRIAGLKMTFGYEDGSYSEFREELIDKTSNLVNGVGNKFFEEGDFENTNEDNTSFNVSCISGFILKLKNADLGYTSSFGYGNQLFTSSGSLYYAQNKIAAFVGYHTSIQGIIYKAGIAYRLK